MGVIASSAWVHAQLLKRWPPIDAHDRHGQPDSEVAFLVELTIFDALELEPPQVPALFYSKVGNTALAPLELLDDDCGTIARCRA